MNKPSDSTKKVLKHSRKYIIFKTIVSLIYRGIAMLTPILFSMAVDEVTNGKFKTGIIISIIGVIAVVIFRIFDIINTYSWHKMYNSMYDEYTRIGIEKVFDNSLYSLSRFNIGEFLNMMSTDINVMCDFYCNLVVRLVRVIEVLIVFVYFFMIDFYIGLAGIAMAVISIVVILLSSNKIEKLNKTKSEYFDNRNTIINEFLLSIREIKTFNIFEPINKRINKSTQTYTKSFLNQRVGEDAFKFSVVAFIEAFRWGMFIYGIFLISKGQMEIGTLLIIYNYFTQLVDGFAEFATINTGIRQLAVSQNRFFQLIIYSRDKLLLNTKYNNEDSDIEFKNIVYGDKLDPRLKDVSFKLENNAINAITGITGSGKSGVVDLLLRLNRQHSGSVYLGDTDIQDIDFEQYYKLISCIDTNDRFLNVSIKENLYIVNPNFDEIVFVCKKLNIHDEISRQKYGYDTIVNSKDDKLTANTKVLLNIARILLKNTHIMIFDEILTVLNEESKDKVLAIFNDIKYKHMIVIVTKDEQVLNMCDNIVLLSYGEVNQIGNSVDIKKNSLYSKIIKD